MYTRITMLFFLCLSYNVSAMMRKERRSQSFNREKFTSQLLQAKLFLYGNQQRNAPLLEGVESWKDKKLPFEKRIFLYKPHILCALDLKQKRKISTNKKAVEKILKELQKKDECIAHEVQDEWLQRNNIMEFAMANKLVELRDAVKMGCDLTLQDYQEKTALHLALEKGYPQAASTLARGVKEYHQFRLFNVQDKNGDTPLHLAVRYGYSDLATHFLQKGADPLIKNKEKFSAILEAEWEQWDNKELLKALKKHTRN